VVRDKAIKNKIIARLTIAIMPPKIEMGLSKDLGIFIIYF
jgi:hypothetical protein